ncbi:RusA family crossover junction endodeoxyribonuclease [Clostridium luticellarii]|jgi:Holliday junction resolvase RusA-like endonuclease|uniref:Endodeoxyribonuclease RusA n=1 Tax=Clostridium luticellarii TaxID=1691940 RepID=A0A2T0BSV9_9CLOT|nr:RusA family crossover junction endodeoxyribonuclease [Clostridium luticellarii]MCI1946053.1 RusA family crossover junction endodeoxyribonuclease [Clostridium luticellarii]MCI1969717.1 RusA family crossover junction endodeoxyribonuclease [Clostridium luticellarii]MCI1995467.1 RusA family crossover junction endodeoxyribonuclease [Clostridium luticellarii]MCI2040621.1 RusA family crossover junction endodeoxyribonuclease [Clostridium luticellarii]PRR86954.1 Endodeoxyribonuclease RusA [Clostridi
MNKPYAKIIVKGSPITKSNFKLFNISGRAILPYNSGKYHDRYALYEEQIAYECRSQNPGTVISESLIAVLKVYYKSKKRHPDTSNITKSIFDGIEKSGLIINDAQIRKIITEEFYDKNNPRFELELFGESHYNLKYVISENESIEEEINYSPPPNKKKFYNSSKKIQNSSEKSSIPRCQICGKPLKKNEIISANKGNTLICKDCFNKLFR